MIDKNQVVTRLTGLVGWDQPFDPSYSILEPDLLISRSGYKVDENPYCQVRTLKETQNYVDISDADFNSKIRGYMGSSISDIANAVFNFSDYIDRQVLYKEPINKVNTVNLPVGFVGHKIEVTDEKNYAFNITRVLLDFNKGASTDVITLVLWSSEKKAPIYTEDILIDSDRVEVALDWVINNTGGIYKGEYYIGYLSTDLVTAKPYKRDYEASNIESCVTGLYIEPIYVQDHADISNIFDLTKTDGLSEANGVNFDITVYEDYTDLIINNEFLFARAIQLAAQIKVLSVYAASLRSNRDQRTSEEMHIKLMAMIEGTEGDDVVKITGLKSMLYGEIKRVKKEIEKIRNGYFSDDMITMTTLC